MTWSRVRAHGLPDDRPGPPEAEGAAAHLDGTVAHRPSPLPILWAAHLIAILPIAIVATVTDPWGGQPKAPPALAPTLAGAAVLAAVASLAIGRAALRSLPAHTQWILRWALAEAVAIMALPTSFLGAPLAVTDGLIALGTLVLLVQYPRGAR